MYKHLAVKKSLILLVAVLLIVAVLFAACGQQPHKPVSLPETATVGSNGGIAVTYGEWIYYVNGYESSVNAANSYVDTQSAPRIGSVLRIKSTYIAEALKIQKDDNLTSSQKTKDIAELIRKNAEIVIPRIYYSANTTTAYFNGIYIFDNRIYILTPNDELTAGGNSQTTQSVLMSYDLGGGNEQRHFTFSSSSSNGNTAQIKLYDDPNSSSHQVMATYLLDNKLHVLKLGKTENETVHTQVTKDDETVSSVNFVENGNRVFYINANGAICQLVDGDTTEQVVVKNAEDWKISYTISSVANTYVYYTIAYENNSTIDNKVLYWAEYDKATADADHKTEAEYAATRKVAVDTSNVTAKGWKENNVVIVRQTDSGYYGLYIISDKSGTTTTLLKPGYNKDSIAINKIVGDELYYTAGGVTYIKNLNDFVKDGKVEANADKETSLGTPYAYSMSTSPTGWALPDIVTVGEHTYMFTFGTGSVSVVEFDSVKKTNSTSATITLTASED